MYRYSNGQISLADFKQPVGMNLKESNRWVKKAQTIPWPEIEKRCAALFTNRKVNVAKPRVWPWEPASFRRSMAILTRKSRFRFRRTHIFSISAGILAMMTKSCPLIRL